VFDFVAEVNQSSVHYNLQFLIANTRRHLYLAQMQVLLREKGLQ